MRRFAAAAFCCLVLTNAVGAQTAKIPEVEVTVDRNRIDEGDSIQYQVTVNNIDGPAKPELDNSPDFEVTYLGETQESSTSIVFSNGRQVNNSRSARRYTYRLTPTVTGTLSIPAPKVTVDGKEYSGRRVTLTVRKATQQDIVYVELATDRPAVYPLQSFAVTVRIFIKALPEPFADREPTIIERATRSLVIPWAEDRNLAEGLKPTLSMQAWLSPLVRRDGKGFRINNFSAQQDLLFFENRQLQFRLATRPVRRLDAKGKEADYWEYSLSRQFQAQKSGTFDFGIATVRGEFVSALTDDNRAELDEIRAVSKRLIVRVKDVPIEGRPEWFTGAIGEFDVSADLTPRVAKIGDPLTLTISMKGSGTLDARPPDLASAPGIAGNFRVYDGAARNIGNERQFTYSVRPVKSDVKVFPPVPIAYFDVRTEKYVTVKTPALKIDVSESDKLGANQVANFGAKPPPPQTVQQPIGIRGNFALPSDFVDETVNPRIWFGLVGSLALAYGIGAAVTTWRKRRPALTFASERNALLKSADRLISEAARLLQDRQPGATDRVRRAMNHLATAMTGMPAEGLTAVELATVFRESKLDVESVRQISQWLEGVEAAQYNAQTTPDDSTADAGIELARRLQRAIG